MKKTADIFKNGECPFGLKITKGCRKVGQCINHMAPLEVLGDDADGEEVLELVKANRKLFVLQGDGTRCPYAGKIIQDKGAVECNFDSTSPGEGSYNFEPSKYYSRVYDNTSYDGLYSYPMGWYGDNNISRNMYYSLWSITSAEYDLVKQSQLKYENPQDRMEHYHKEYRELPQDVLKQILVNQINKIAGYEVWLVDGNKVRDLVDVDFVEGGNPARYQYVPRNQIWVEENLSEEDRVATVVHEIFEMNQMFKGESYSEAHDNAAEIEKEIRNLFKKAISPDIADAAQHAIIQEDSSFTGTACYKIISKELMDLNKILEWDDYSSWGDFDPGELKDLGQEKFEEVLNKFRPGFASQVKGWKTIPPIILVETKEAVRMVGDGRGRVNLAVGLGLPKLPVIILKEQDDGDICFRFKNGIISYK